ncbi:FAD-dependent oxidoreductase [Cognataquiflexum rubidum]|uniref:FAD-dependent oxidoreductase n=1 Tax=Cognataquiflexum rubidum TaxID=2922273 RepID=UPI001F12F6AB|nr:FAD-dependent oxidoreductase [Cognataquiflexum rubidum]MCH6235582.1 FAD-dependent oxidoreductase [Cognataquiflexum rubidum]
MKKEDFVVGKRKLKTENISSDLVIVGGGLAGTCCAITAARHGVKVTLVQDRPVLGGNGSSEVRLWILGATSHMGNNNRWAREGGVVDEILVENLYRNPEGNPLILDTILIEKVSLEPNIRLLLNTAAYDLNKKGDDQIESVLAFCSQNSTEYLLKAPLFVDASGDGILGFLVGAAYRIGAESKEEFDEGFAPDQTYGELLGHSLYFYSKDTGKPVRFIPPSYANTEIAKLPRFRSFNLKEHGCRLWWVEYGGRKDTIHDSEEIKWELWRVIYGIWNHIKNSGEYPDSENLTLEWVGTIPGKRESRRFEGDYMLTQKDVVEQRPHFDAVSFGGWALDLHPAEGVFGDKPGCTQWHSKGVYQIPYRTMYSKNIKNLFLGGRLISATHVAFGSSRVMATCAHNTQAVGLAASICIQNKLLPADLREGKWIEMLQQSLIESGQYIPHFRLEDKLDLIKEAKITSSSELEFSGLPFDGPWYPLDFSMAQMIPIQSGVVPEMKIQVKSAVNSKLAVELRVSEKTENYTPEVILEHLEIDIEPGENFYSFSFQQHSISVPQYVFVTFVANSALMLKCSNARVTGLLSVFNKFNKSVATSSRQEPPPGIGIDSFEFWVPERRLQGHNLAFELARSLRLFSKENIRSGIFRPTTQPNAWVASLEDSNPSLTLEWTKEQKISTVQLHFDTDFDHPMESTLMGHPESEIPFCTKSFMIKDDSGAVIYHKKENHQTIQKVQFPSPIRTQKLTFEFEKRAESVPLSVFGISCYSLSND